MMIDRHSTYKAVYNMPEFKEIKEYLSFLPSQEILDTMGNMTISSNVPEAWNPDDIAQGLNHILNLRSKGIKMLYSIYSNKEKEENPDKSQTGMLWFPSDKKGPFALICAGGGYMGVASNVEAFPVAYRLNEMGINVFVLKYRTGIAPAAEKAEEDLHTAIQYIFQNRTDFHVSDNFAIFGFSSGGHLVAEYGTNNRGYRKHDLPKPKMLCLAYPALNLDYRSDVMNTIVDIMLKSGWKEADKEEFNVLKHIDNSYPATFLWQTVTDETIPYDQNFIPLVNQLKKNHVTYSAKTVQHGGHGLGMGNGSEAEGWVEEAVTFWKNI